MHKKIRLKGREGFQLDGRTEATGQGGAWQQKQSGSVPTAHIHSCVLALTASCSITGDVSYRSCL